jgi:hypothetical protein
MVLQTRRAKPDPSEVKLDSSEQRQAEKQLAQRHCRIHLTTMETQTG